MTMRKNLWKKRTAGLLTVLVIAVIFYLTLQRPEDTWRQTNKTQSLLGTMGIQLDVETLRHNAHYVEYFVLSLALCAFCRSRKWKLSRAVLLGCAIGLADELLKNWLPTREFDFTDLIRDMIGVSLAAVIVTIIRIVQRK